MSFRHSLRSHCVIRYDFCSMVVVRQFTRLPDKSTTIMKLQFLGAAQEVTGSKHLITTNNGHTILLDCGMYQGKGMETDAANRDLGFDPKSLDCVVLSHAHIDHSGLLPYIYKLGFRGDIYCTPATRDLCAIVLADTAYIQAQDIRWYNKKMDKLHQPKAEPLYDLKQVDGVMRHFVTVSYGRPIRLFDDTMLTFTNSGHMLGSAICNLEITEQEGYVAKPTKKDQWYIDNMSAFAPTPKNMVKKRIAFTGDIGRPHSHILPAPMPFPQCDYLITESTYGDRLHEGEQTTEEELLEVVHNTCVRKQGKLLIPSFSVGRTQEIVYVLNNLYNDGRLPHIPVYVDSPLAVNATEIFRMYMSDLNESVQDTLRFDSDPFGFNTLKYVKDINESKKLNHSDAPAIIIAASGMLEAGRIKHHVANHIADPSTTILIVGYCTPTSLGARIQDPSKRWISIFGMDRKINAEIIKIEAFSGHGDYSEMTQYLSSGIAPKQVKQTFIVHGEPLAQEAFKGHLHDAGFRNISIPKKGEEVELKPTRI